MMPARAGLRFAAVAVVALPFASPALAAPPRDEALRLAPQDAALVLLVQNARDHARNVSESPFAEWFPTSTLGKQLLGAGGLKGLTQSVAPLLAELGTNPDELLNDVLGDAVVFAYTPGANASDERAVILVRPRKPETLSRLIDRINAAQSKSGEVKSVVRKTHGGEPYFAREKAGGGLDFYCFRGSVFAFSSTESDIAAVIDRDRAAARDSEPELSLKLKKLGVADVLAAALVNPRPLDAELDARIAAAKPDDRAFLERFREVWQATDAAAVYLDVGRELEAGVSVRFDPAKVPAWARGWVNGARTPSALWAAIPDDALVAVGGRFRAAELLQLVLAVLPEEGQKTLNAALSDSLGPIVGKDKLPLVLDSLGPDWAVWAELPRGENVLPVVVAAMRVNGDNPDAGNAILDGIDYGFRTFRVLYNSGHADQIEMKREKDGDATITSLVNDKAFPPGFRPSFALKNGYLLLASNPDAIRRFRASSEQPKPSGEVRIARFNGTTTRSYFSANGPKLAKFLASLGSGDEKELVALIGQLVVVLEPVDHIDVVMSGDDASLRIAVRVKLVKDLKK